MVIELASKKASVLCLNLMPVIVCIQWLGRVKVRVRSSKVT